MKTLYMAVQVPDDFISDEIYLGMNSAKSPNVRMYTPQLLEVNGEPFGWHISYPKSVPFLTQLDLPNFVTDPRLVKKIAENVAKTVSGEITVKALFDRPGAHPALHLAAARHAWCRQHGLTGGMSDLEIDEAIAIDEAVSKLTNPFADDNHAH